MLEGERRARDEILMDAYGAIDLTAAAKSIAERQVRFDGLLLDLENLQEYLDRLVGTVFEEIIQPAQVVR